MKESYFLVIILIFQLYQLDFLVVNYRKSLARLNRKGMC